MSKAELLEEVARMSPLERDEFWAALCSLEDERLLKGAVSEEEKKILEAELREYSADSNLGTSWAEVKSRLLRPS